jgi:hypothetical protein
VLYRLIGSCATRGQAIVIHSPLRPAPPDGGAPTSQTAQAERRITLQKLPGWKFGSLSAITSASTLPKVVSGSCLMPS